MDKANQKYHFSRQLQISEFEIDESILPILKANELLKDQLNETIEALILDNKKLNEAIKSSIKPVYYENARTAFFGNIGKYGITVISISIVGMLCYWAYVFKEINSNKYKNLERLSAVVEVKDSVYFIPKGKYRQQKNGIIIIENKNH